jgi:hypothetical protein
MLIDKLFKELVPGIFIEDEPPLPLSGGSAPPPDPPADPPPVDPAGDGATPPVAATPPEPPPQPPAPAADWRDKQIDRQHRRLKEEQDRVAALAAENEQMRQMLEARQRQASDQSTPPAPQAPPPAPTPQTAPPAGQGDPVAVARFQLEVEQIGQRLTTEYGNDWPEVSKRFEQMGGMAPQVMQSILATDDPAYVIIQLGKKPEKYQEILDLPPAKQTAALIKIGLEKNAAASAAAARPAPKPSDAPPPVEHLSPGGRAPSGAINLYDDKTEDDRWFAERMRQKRESVGRPWSLNRQGAR